LIKGAEQRGVLEGGNRRAGSVKDYGVAQVIIACGTPNACGHAHACGTGHGDLTVTRPDVQTQRSAAGMIGESSGAKARVHAAIRIDSADHEIGPAHGVVGRPGEDYFPISLQLEGIDGITSGIQIQGYYAVCSETGIEAAVVIQADQEAMHNDGSRLVQDAILPSYHDFAVLLNGHGIRRCTLIRDAELKDSIVAERGVEIARRLCCYEGG